MKIKLIKSLAIAFLVSAGFTLQTRGQENKLNQKINASEMMFRISEIEIYPEHLESYNAILKEEAAASVKLEPGVISIFPLYQKDKPYIFRILEIYASREAYQAHLQTSHFKHYKESTLIMVKSLSLVDMKALDDTTIDLIFKKMKK